MKLLNSKSFLSTSGIVILLFLLIFILLKLLQYSFYSNILQVEAYVLITAVLFAAAGVFAAYSFRKRENKKIEQNISNPLPPGTEITSRELEVLSAISKGYSNKQIAEEMFISLNTVKSHTANIYGKLEVKNRLQAVNRAKKLKIIQ